MPDATTVLIVDDHALVRGMLADRLSMEVDLSVISTASDAGEALQATSQHGPDIVLMDIDMPGLACFEAARQIRSAHPQTAIVFLSAHCQDGYVEQALEAGAAGYLTKDEPLEVVLSAVRTVAGGGSYFSAEVQGRLVVDPKGARLGRRGQTRASTLTPREREILRYVARGLSQKQMAEVTSRSSKTIHKHCNNIMAKLDLHDRVELTRFAIREGLAEA